MAHFHRRWWDDDDALPQWITDDPFEAALCAALLLLALALIFAGCCCLSCMCCGLNLARDFVCRPIACGILVLMALGAVADFGTRRWLAVAQFFNVVLLVLTLAWVVRWCCSAHNRQQVHVVVNTIPALPVVQAVPLQATEQTGLLEMRPTAQPPQPSAPPAPHVAVAVPLPETK